MRVLGLDVGIGSCGWGVLEIEEVDEATGEVVQEDRVVACGARCFDVPEEAKTKELKSKARRSYRGQRRVVRRRAQRLAEVRRVLAQHGLPAQPGALPPGTPSGIVWTLRAEGLRRRLEPEELSRALIHIAKHRGFKSNSRRAQANATSDDGKMLAAVTALDQKSAGYRTVGEMLARDPAFALRKRNTAGDYSHTLKRERLEQEARTLLAEQRRLGNAAASEVLQAEYVAAAFFQRPLQSSVTMIGKCRFEPDQIRSPRHAPSYERFRFLSRLNNLRLGERASAPRPLDLRERKAALALFGTTQKVTFKQLRKALGLAEETRFDGLPATKDPEAATFAEATGTVTLRKALGEVRFANLRETDPEKLDAAMAAIVFYETDEEVERELRRAKLEDRHVEALLKGLEAFAGFRGVGHVSAKACRRLLPHLEAGCTYDEACRREGYDHAAIGRVELKDVPNPVVRKVVAEVLKQIKVVVRAYGMPDRLHIEMARDVGKSAADRKEIYRAGQERAADRERHRAEFVDTHGRRPNDEELERYELWKEQDHRCLYTGAYISPEQLVATDNSIQVDHILPYSRSGDDSFRNKALVTAKANQDKRDRTLWEWFGESDPKRWAELETRIGLLRSLHKEKRRKLLLKSFAEREDKYRERHLQDTRYVVRVLRALIEQHWPDLATRKDEPRRIFVRPGAVTAMVRRGLGVDQAKKGGALGDRDHALDALVVAWTTESLLNRLTDAVKVMEQTARNRHVPTLVADPHERERLRRMFLDAAEAVFVSRPEVRRGRGPAHDATLYGFERTADGEFQHERKRVDELKLADLDRLKGDPARNIGLREALAAWLEACERDGVKPVKRVLTEPPRMPAGPGKTGPAIRSVVVRRRASSGIKILRGDAEAHVDLATMVRVDVFAKGGKNYLVPVYAYQVADRASWPQPPMMAVKGNSPEERWHQIDTSFTFRFSLWPSALVSWPAADGRRLFGYFRSLDRNTGAIKVSPPADGRSESQTKISPMSITDFRKHHVDRLGHITLVEKEPRLWHGVVCM